MFFQLFILVHYFKQQITTMWVNTNRNYSAIIATLQITSYALDV